MSKTPLDYAKAGCDTMMRKFTAENLPPVGHFHYHQGVFLSGVLKTWKLTGDEKYYDYAKAWVDSCLDENGQLKNCDRGELDDMQPGILLYPMYERTGNPVYKQVLDSFMDSIRHFPRCPEGGFWHKWHRDNQMWLDGLYMGGPVAAEYAKRFDAPDLMDIVTEQPLLMRRFTEDENTGLWYHAWDSSRKAEWSDPDTGKSPEFWGRSIGWVPVAVLDDLDFIPEDHKDRPALEQLVRDLMAAVVRYQSEEGRWYQVVDKGDREGNWLETSCSCLFTAAICKGVRKGILDSSMLEAAKKGYEGVIRSLGWDGEDVLVGNVCIGTGVGDYDHYIHRPTSVNDLHGMGAFLIMCAEACEVGLV